MELKIIYEDRDLLVLEKPPGIIVFPERETKKKTFIDLLLESYPNLKKVGQPPRYGIIHRLDKETSGILLVAKSKKALAFFQKQFKERGVIKKYIGLVSGRLKENFGRIETLIGRSPKNRQKEKIYLPFEPKSKGKRKAITEYQVLEKFQNYTLCEVTPKTGRKHQIRVHFRYLGYPIVGDKIYGFKNQKPKRENLKRHFLHASYLKIKLPDGKEREFKSDLPKELRKVIENLNPL
jgi:23S rRNA pseudouridine1911/1915/1917 synthase